MTGYQLSDTDRQRLGLAVHEAAHAVVGVLHGATVESATLTADGSDGDCTFTSEVFATSTRGHRSLIAAAGAAAAAVFHHGPQPSLRQVEAQLGDSDREDLRLTSLSSRQSLPEQLTEVLPVVLRCWSAIGTLAAGLYLGNELSHADVCTALGLADGGGPGSLELAIIRSGGAPGTFTVVRAVV